MKKQITIFGATGFVGKHLVKLALKRGYQVKALVRSKEKLGELSQKIEIIEGDYFDYNLIDQALEGSSFVLSTVGPPLKVKNIKASDYHNALKYLVKRIEEKGIKKFINITGAGIIYPGEQLPFGRKILRLLLKLMAKQMIEVKDGELNILFNSKINFVSVRPPMIKELEGDYKTDANAFVGMGVGVDQICNFMLDNIDLELWNRKAPLIGNK